MTPSTVSRQLGTLAATGLVERVPSSGRYRLGIRLVHLANAVLARLDVREVARPHLTALVDATGETATLSVPGDEDAITVDFVSGSHQIQPVSRLGRPSIAHATSAGKVMLAFAGRELPDGPFRGYTTRTITDRQALATEIESVRERGYAQAVGRARARAHGDRGADPLGARRARGDRGAPRPERALRQCGGRCCAPVPPRARRSDLARARLGLGLRMLFDTKIAVVLRDDLAVWQKTNVTAFLVSGIAGTVPGVVGEPYRDGSGNEYLPMFVQPVLVYEANAQALRRAYERACARDVPLAVYTADLFATGHDEANRAAVADVTAEELDLVGIAFRAERKIVDKVVDGLRFHP